MADFFSTNIICDICDKYEVCGHADELMLMPMMMLMLMLMLSR